MKKQRQAYIVLRSHNEGLKKLEYLILRKRQSQKYIGFNSLLNHANISPHKNLRIKHSYLVSLEFALRKIILSNFMRKLKKVPRMEQAPPLQATF